MAASRARGQQEDSSSLQWVFCYGSNHAEQLAARVQRDTAHQPLRVRPAHLRDHVRIFAGNSSKRWGGGVASVHPALGGRVYGTVAGLTMAELRKLDAFEGGYTRVRVDVALDDEAHEPEQLLKGVHVYVMDDPRLVRLPSPAYMAAIRKQLDGRGAGRTRPAEALLVRGVVGGQLLLLGRWDPAAPDEVQRAAEHAARLDEEGWWKEEEEGQELAGAPVAGLREAAEAAEDRPAAVQEGVACEA